MDKSEAPDGSALLRVEVAARTLQIGRSKAYQLIATGELPSVRIGAAVRVPRRPLTNGSPHEPAAVKPRSGNGWSRGASTRHGSGTGASCDLDSRRESR